MIDTTKPVNRDGNRFCGPLVTAALLDCSTGMVERTIQNARNSRRPVKSVKFETECIPLLKMHGLKVADEPLRARYRGVRTVWASAATGRYYYARGLPNQRPIGIPADAVPWTLVKRRCPTLGAVLCSLPKNATFIVRVTGHVLLVHGNKMTETYTGGTWVDRWAAPRERRIVHTVWRVEA